MNEIKKEDQEFLEKLSEEMNSQNKRSTSYPIFVVYDKVKVYRDDGEEKERKSECDDMCDRCSELSDNGEDLPEDCDDCENNNCFVNFDWEDQIQEDNGIYFTAKACNEYIQRRRYAFYKPWSYAISGYFSEEMKRVMEIISKLTSDENTLR